MKCVIASLLFATLAFGQATATKPQPAAQKFRPLADRFNDLETDFHGLELKVDDNVSVWKAEVQSLRLDNAALQRQINELSAKLDKIAAAQPKAAATPTTNPAGKHLMIGGMCIGDEITTDFIHKCVPARESDNPKSASDTIKIGDSEVFVFYAIENRKVIGISISFDPKLFDQLLDVYTERLGSPSVQNIPVETKVGAKYTNVVANWITPDGIFQLSKYGDSVDKGSGAIVTQALMNRIDADNAAQKAEIKAKL